MPHAREVNRKGAATEAGGRAEGARQPAGPGTAPSPATAPTALMRQYLDVKARYPDAIVFFRLGDFYEMFYDDATYVARALSLTLTTRDKGKEDPVPMCGIPHHAARGYLSKLTALGHRIAICEQMEDPRAVRGIVRRDVVRVVTPGVILDEEALDPRAPSHVAAVLGDGRRGFGLAFLDVTTGSFRATEAPTLDALVDELARAEPRELVLSRADGELAAVMRRAYPRLPQIALADGRSAFGGGGTAGDPLRALAETLGATWNPALAEKAPLGVAAAAMVLGYARATQPAATLPVTALDLFQRAETLIIDEQARAHLELVETLLERKRAGSVIDVLDQSRSAMGGRMLRRWLLFPLVDVARIRRRQDAVERLVDAHAARDAARKVLGELGDLERLVGRARLGVATPRDLVSLGASLRRLPELAEALRAAAAGEIHAPASRDKAAPAGAPAPPDAAGADGDLALLDGDLGADVADAIAETLRDDAPATTKEGGVVRPGFSVELDELTAIAAGGRQGLADIETRERERTGIASLKVRYNSVFGYYIEVTRSQLERVPADYVRKQTVANAERFVTPELGDYEAKILSADERRIALETEIFTALRERVGRDAQRLLGIGARVATVDVLAALAEVAHRNGYCRPVVDDGVVLDISDGRHPVVERFVERFAAQPGDWAAPSGAAGSGGFVPNDVRLDPQSDQILIVTGPNMAGKSTLIRQVALTVVLAQMGSFVPARAARIGLADRVFTRVGAGDNLARGESTFLVEMKETAHILRYAGPRSLIILDEIGRGTSTYDGVSIAWAVAEHLHDVVGARTLFATHYHELCALADTHPRVRNVSVGAREWQGEVVFLRKLIPGGTSRSFGIDVAKLAGLPAPVIERARRILTSLEGGQSRADSGPGTGAGPRAALPGDPGGAQLGLFGAPVVVGNTSAEPALNEVAEALRALDPDGLTPRQALDVLVELKKKLT